MGILSRLFGRRDAPSVDLQARSTTAGLYSPVPGWAGPAIFGSVNFGSIGPTVTLKLNIGSLADDLQSCAWAYLGITKNSEAVAQLPPVIQTYQSGQWVKSESHPLNALIRAPLGSTSEPPNWSWSDWIKVAAIHLQMADYGFVAHVIRNLINPTPIALWPAIFAPLSIDESPQHWPTYYHHGNLDVWPASDVLHIRKAHPSSFTRSMSVFRAALPSIRIDAIARQRVEANLNNRIAPGCLITVKGLQTISPEKQKATIDAVREQVGLSTQDGTPLVGGEGWELMAPPPNAGETGANPARTEARREILASIGVPEVMVTTVEADRSSQLERVLYWWQGTLFGLAGDIYGQTTAQLIPAEQQGKVRIWYELAGTHVALALLQSQAAVAKSLTDIGYSTNDAAARVGLGMPNRPELDTPNQKQVIAGREPADAKPKPAAEDADDEEENNGNP